MSHNLVVTISMRPRLMRRPTVTETRRHIEAVLVGYAVSTDVQHLDLQLDALAGAGAGRVYRDTGSGSLKHRPSSMLASPTYGRRHTPGLPTRSPRPRTQAPNRLVEQLQGREIGFSITDRADRYTTTPAGRLQFHLFGTLAEFEHEIIRERTRAGLVAARARGRNGGRPATLTPEKVAAAEAMRAAGQPTVQIARVLRVIGQRFTATLSRELARTLALTPETSRPRGRSSHLKPRVPHSGDNQRPQRAFPVGDATDAAL
jgi:hypothetical protein